jgi:hypothetical protein
MGPPRSDRNRAGERVIPERFDPTYDGEPEFGGGEDTKAEPLEGLTALQMPKRRSGRDVTTDPEDEPTDLPAEEQAMHVVTEHRRRA